MIWGKSIKCPPPCKKSIINLRKGKKFLHKKGNIHHILLGSAISFWGLPGNSASKESSCNAEDPGSIPGSGRFPGEVIGCPLQYSWASLVAQMVKNHPAVRETWVWSLGCKVPLEEGMATHSSILAWAIPMDRGAWWTTVYKVLKIWTRLSTAQQHISFGAIPASFLWTCLSSSQWFLL